jgi:hypothetical protein
MEVKGTGLISTRLFMKDRHSGKYQEWLNALPIEIRTTFNGLIDTGQWFDIEKYYYIPLKKIAELCYHDDEKMAAIDAGQYSAEYGLKGVYKVFLMIASPQSLMKASKRIISLYYQPVNVEIDEIKKNSLVLSWTKLLTKSKILDYRVVGWCTKALELANCKNVVFEEIEPKYHGMFSIKLSWS